MFDRLKLIEPVRIPIVFVSGLATCDDMGDGCFLFTCFTQSNAASSPEVSLRFVAPREAIGPAIGITATAIGFSFFGGGGAAQRHLH